MEIWRAFLGELDEKDQVDSSESFADTSLAPRTKGAAVGNTRTGKGAEWMEVVDGQGISLGDYLIAANKSEITFIEDTLDNARAPWPQGRLQQKPTRLIYDRRQAALRCVDGSGTAAST